MSYESALTSLTHSLSPHVYLNIKHIYTLSSFILLPYSSLFLLLFEFHTSTLYSSYVHSTSTVHSPDPHPHPLISLAYPHCYASPCIRPRSRSWSFPCCIFIHAVALYEDPRCSLDILPQIQNTEIKKTVDLIPVSVGFHSNLRQAFNIHACRSGVLSGCSQDRLANRDRMSRVY